MISLKTSTQTYVSLEMIPAYMQLLIAQILNLDLKRLYNWAVQCIVKFNPIKTESILFSRRINLQVHPALSFNDVPIQADISHKRLGVYVSQRCDWQTHIDFYQRNSLATTNSSTNA